MSESDMIGDTAVDNVNMEEKTPETEADTIKETIVENDADTIKETVAEADADVTNETTAKTEGDTINETTAKTEESSSSPNDESGETDKKDTTTIEPDKKDTTITDTPLAPAAGEIPHDDDDEYEYETEVRRTVIKKTMKITETTSTTKTTPLSTGPIGIEKLYGKDLSEYDDIDVDTLLSQLSPEEINLLAKEVDPDDSFLPPNQRCSYDCEKTPTGPLNRKKLIEHINKQAIETPDVPEFEPYVKGTVRGKKWIPPPQSQREMDAEEQIAIDMGEEYEHALSSASQEEIIDLAAILGFHSMMNQDQYHASLLNKGQPVGLGWDGITKSSTQKVYPHDPPNQTDVEDSIKRVKDDDSKLIELNMNNIKNISDEKLEQLFKALPENEHLEVLSLTNVGLTDRNALLLAEAIEKSKTLRVLNVETNFISPPVIVSLVKSLLKCRTVEEFRATNQRSSVLGNKIEMEITELVEKNNSLLRLGLHLEYNDARHRVAAHLQRNIDRIVRVEKLKPNLPKLILPGNIGIEPDMFNMNQIKNLKQFTPSPTPSPIPPQDYDVEFDPDNIVIRGGGGDYCDDDDDDNDAYSNRSRSISPNPNQSDDNGLVIGEPVGDFSFSTHTTPFPSEPA